MKAIEAYQTDDGQIFHSLLEAEIHEEREKHMPEINAFIASNACKYNNCSHKKIVQNTLLAWIFWKADGGIDQ